MVSRISKTIKEIIDLYVRLSSGIYGENGCYHTECWQWVGSLDEDGYGQLTHKHKHYRAHRFLYEHWMNKSLFDMQLDHLCRNRACVNPYHLEPVTLQENLRRGSRYNKSHCVNGHEFTLDNTYTTSSGYRQCRTCKKFNQQKYMERKSCRLN